MPGSWLSGMWLWILLGVIPFLLPLVAIVISLLVSLVDRAEASPIGNTVQLKCYHCGRETAANRKTCVHCDGELQ